MKKRDYYIIAGVSGPESAEGIKDAYRKPAKKYHPDKSRSEQTRLQPKISEARYARSYSRALLPAHAGAPLNEVRPAPFSPELSRYLTLYQNGCQLPSFDSGVMLQGWGNPAAKYQVILGLYYSAKTPVRKGDSARTLNS